MNEAQARIDCLLCNKCNLRLTRKQVVWADGSSDSRIMFIGEAPGREENEQGKPFVGDAGRYFNTLLRSLGLGRDGVYVCNIVKCWPRSDEGGNRTPTKEEIEACSEWIDKQIELVDPKIVVTLGRTPLQKFVAGGIISQLHGKGKKEKNKIYLYSYHPAAILHNRGLKQDIEMDFKRFRLVFEKYLPEKEPEGLPL